MVIIDLHVHLKVRFHGRAISQTPACLIHTPAGVHFQELHPLAGLKLFSEYYKCILEHLERLECQTALVL